MREPIVRLGRFFERVYKLQLHRFLRVAAELLTPYRPARRRWGIGLPLKALNSIQAGALKHEYRGRPMLKNPFDVALYPLLIWKTKPRTVIEIGSYLGVSAFWLADLVRDASGRGLVISIDIAPPTPPEARDDVRFLKGDVMHLGAVLTPELLAGLERPWLVIEDSAHTQASTRAALEFFAPHLQAGEYIVVEDGALADFGWAFSYGGGPGMAISRFLAAHPEFEIDADYCDRYGHNVTGNPNGYLRRRA
jgi:cephalosporin hydroxylase